MCELRDLYKIMKPGGIISVSVPGMTANGPSMRWKPNDVNFEFQMYGALELGNLLTAAGFLVDPKRDPCLSEVIEWPQNYKKAYGNAGSLDKFIELSLHYGKLRRMKITTWCVARKPKAL